MTSDNHLTEALAAYAHEAWAGWMKYLRSKAIYMGEGQYVLELISRWTRQTTTDYADLPEEEKASDREQAEAILRIIKKHSPTF